MKPKNADEESPKYKTWRKYWGSYKEGNKPKASNIESIAF